MHWPPRVKLGYHLQPKNLCHKFQLRCRAAGSSFCRRWRRPWTSLLWFPWLGQKWHLSFDTQDPKTEPPRARFLEYKYWSNDHPWLLLSLNRLAVCRGNQQTNTRYLCKHIPEDFPHKPHRCEDGTFYYCIGPIAMDWKCTFEQWNDEAVKQSLHFLLRHHFPVRKNRKLLAIVPPFWKVLFLGPYRTYWALISMYLSLFPTPGATRSIHLGHHRETQHNQLQVGRFLEQLSSIPAAGSWPHNGALCWQESACE